MAGSLSNYAEDAILKWLTGQSTQPISTVTNAVTVQLLSTLPTETGTTTTGTSGSATGGTVAAGFSALTPTPANWISATNAVSETGGATVYTYTGDLSFTYGAGQTSNVTVVGVGLYANNNLLAWTDINPSKTLAPGETLVIPTGTFKLQLT